MERLYDELSNAINNIAQEIIKIVREIVEEFEKVYRQVQIKPEYEIVRIIGRSNVPYKKIIARARSNC